MEARLHTRRSMMVGGLSRWGYSLVRCGYWPPGGTALDWVGRDRDRALRFK